MNQSFAYHNDKLGAVTAGGWSPLEACTEGKTHPVYVYNMASVQKRIDFLKNKLSGTDTRMFYAMKANSHESLLELMKKSGLGIDVVSGGEARWALEKGFHGGDIIFSGVGKSKDEIVMAIEKGFYQINAESVEEVARIAALAAAIGKPAHLGIRINPNIKPDTHPYITTGFRENKFGISEYQVQDALQIVNAHSKYLQLRGLSAHIGSQIRDLKPLTETIHALTGMARTLKAQGHPLTTLDFGGGIGIDYSSMDETGEFEMMASFSDNVREARKEFDGQFLLEPGRTLVGRAGVLLTQIEYVKFNGYKKFLIVNTGMHHLLRPSLYKAHHRILPLENTGESTEFYDVVGPICESSDVLGYDRQLPPMREGQWLAIMDAGAYGMSMSSFYNRHEPPEEICVY